MEKADTTMTVRCPLCAQYGTLPEMVGKEPFHSLAGDATNLCGLHAEYFDVQATSADVPRTA